MRVSLPAKQSSQTRRDVRASAWVGTRERQAAACESSPTAWQARSEANGLPTFPRLVRKKEAA
jgi:hypothetical protein